MDKEFWQKVVAIQEEGRRAALITIVRTLGSTPREAGARMLVTEDGEMVGTIGGGCGEADAVGRARQVIQFDRPELYRLDMTADLAADEGMACGGIMELFMEPLALERSGG